MNTQKRFVFGALIVVVPLILFLGILGALYKMAATVPQTETISVENVGYAGEAVQFDEDTIYIQLFTDYGDIDVMNQFVSSEGTLVWENSDRWTSTGYYPKKGDLVKVRVTRQRRNGELIHGYSVTEFISHPKPFGLIGKEIQATPDFYSQIKLARSLVEPIIVLDANKDVVRVKLANGKIDTYGWGWFQVPQEDLPVSHHWEVGNQFKVGDVVCLNREDGTQLPTTTTVTEIGDSDLIKVDGYTSEIGGWVDFTNYVLCSK